MLKTLEKNEAYLRYIIQIVDLINKFSAENVSTLFHIGVKVIRNVTISNHFLLLMIITIHSQ